MQDNLLKNFASKFFSRDGKGSLSDRVSNNEKKITSLKNILKTQKITIGEQLRGLGKSPVEESRNQILGDIDQRLDALLQTIREDNQLEIDAAEAARKKAEKDARAKKEKDLEKWENLKATTSKVLKPFKNIWDKIIGFLKTVLLGNILMKILDWMGDKKNQGKIKSIFRFLEDWWPTLLAAYVLFGNSLGRFVVGFLAKVGVWVAKSIPMMIKALAAALAKLKAMKWIKLLGGRRGMRALQATSALVGTGMILTGNTPSGRDEDTNQIPALEGDDNTLEFNKGGEVPGSGNKDTVPAMLTPGEFVMSKNAVQKYGVNTLEGMNAAAGGTNKPEIDWRSIGLGGGGGGTDSLTEQAKVKTWGSAIGDFLSGDDGRSRYMTDLEKSQRMSGGGLIQHFSGGGLVEKFKLQYPDLSTEQIQEVIDEQQMRMNRAEKLRKESTAHPLLRPPKVTRRSLEERVSSVLRMDYGSSPDRGTEIDISDAWLDAERKRAISAEKNINRSPITIAPSTTIEKNIPQVPAGSSVTIIKKGSTKKTANNPITKTSQGTSIPDFDAELYLSTEKIKTLGITI